MGLAASVGSIRGLERTEESLAACSLVRVGICVAILTALAGCATPPPHPSSLATAELLSGAALFEAPVPREVATRDQVFGIDDEMRAFVTDDIRRTRRSEFRLRRLLGRMAEQGLFSLDYSTDITRTVRETFYARQGNCLSSTMLFVALAREAGLKVSYQIVDIPPTWTFDSDLVLLNTHIDALVATTFREGRIVDFNDVDFKGNYDRHEVSDDYALALYYNNIGAEAFIARDFERSFANFRAAIETYPDIAGPWVNLGLLYYWHGLHEQSEAAYLEALAVEPDNRSALTNLSSLYAKLGDEERAESYRDRVRRYQQKNPYYHYRLAEQAYSERRFDDALELLDAAIRLKRNEHQFYSLQAQAYFELGQRRDAENSFTTAKRYANLAETRAQYDAKLAALAER
jgi:tetratricopeptide (TPR) repeat protein